MTAHDPMQKEMAREKKDERKHEAEYEKQAAREHNAAQRQAEGTTGVTGHHTGLGGTGHHTTGTGGTYWWMSSREYTWLLIMCLS